MNTLYDKKRLRMDDYVYKINRGGEFNIQSVGTITIHFLDGNFAGCDLPFNLVTREQWRIVTDVATEILRLEAGYTQKEP